MMYETSYNIITFLFCYFSFWPIFVMALMYILWCATWLAHYKCHIITSFFIFTLRTSIFHFFLYISNAKIYVCIKSSVSTVTTVSKHSTLTNIHILIKCRILKLLVWFWSISQTDYLQWQKCHLTTVSCMEYVKTEALQVQTQLRGVSDKQNEAQTSGLHGWFDTHLTL